MKQQLLNKIAELVGLGNEAIGTRETTLRGVINALIAKIRSMFDTKDATATAAEVLAGKTAYNADGKITGVIETYSGSFMGNGEVLRPNNTNPTAIYLLPNNEWKTDGARFAAYFFDAANNFKWVSGVYQSSDGTYKFLVPSGNYNALIFCRMNPANSTNDWNNKWNQTANLTLPTNDYVRYEMTSGTWDQTADECWESIKDRTSVPMYSNKGVVIQIEKQYAGKEILVRPQTRARSIVATTPPIIGSEEQMNLLVSDPTIGQIGSVYIYNGQESKVYDTGAMYILQNLKEVEE